MTTKERNRHIRELATEIAQWTGLKLKEWGLLRKAWTPKCIRVTRTRGHGYAGAVFSIPGWAARNTNYFLSYAIHEALHCFHYDHGQRMRDMERRLLAEHGLTPQFFAHKPNYIEKLYAGDTLEFDYSKDLK